MIRSMLARATRARTHPRRSACACIGLVFAAGSAQGACSLAAQGVNFGTYDPSDSVAADSAGNVAVTCDLGTAYTIALSSGSGSYASRTLLSGADVLEYNLYSDAAHLFVWGDGSAASTSVAGNGTGSTTNFPVYARLPAHQYVRRGSYADVIVVTLMY